MKISSRLFRTIDIITVLTGVSVEHRRCSKVDELVRYVTGHRSMPKKESRARQNVIAEIRSQLPCGFNQFGMSDLIDLIMQINKGQQEDQLRLTVVRNLEDRYGSQMTLCPVRNLETASASLNLLRSLAEKPDANFILE